MTKLNNDSKPGSVAAATPPQQAGEARLPRAPWGWVERGVWTERRLTRLTAGESADRVWFRRWDKTSAPANLQSALHKVWKNGGSAGADEQTVAHFGRRAEEELQRRHEQLREGTGRLVQGTLRHVREPIFETDRAEHSYGFRPGRGAQDARRRVATRLKAGHDWVGDADLKNYFDTIPHERLLALVTERVGDGRGLALGESFLRAEVLEEAKGWQPTGRGTPQGGVISPLLANLYLNPRGPTEGSGGGEGALRG